MSNIFFTSGILFVLYSCMAAIWMRHQYVIKAQKYMFLSYPIMVTSIVLSVESVQGQLSLSMITCICFVMMTFVSLWYIIGGYRLQVAVDKATVEQRIMGLDGFSKDERLASINKTVYVGSHGTIRIYETKKGFAHVSVVASVWTMKALVQSVEETLITIDSRKYKSAGSLASLIAGILCLAVFYIIEHA